MQVWNVLHAAGWKYMTQKIAKNSRSAHHRTTLSDYIFATKARVENRKKNLWNSYIFSTCPPQYGERRPTNGWDRFQSLGHPSKFQRVSRLGFVTAATSLTGGQPNLAWSLAVSLAGTLYTHFLGLLPLTNFWKVQNSLYIEALRSPILHGTPAAGVSQTLRRGITELSQKAPPIFGWAAITLGIGPHCSMNLSFILLLCFSFLSHIFY